MIDSIRFAEMFDTFKISYSRSTGNGSPHDNAFDHSYLRCLR